MLHIAAFQGFDGHGDVQPSGDAQTTAADLPKFPCGSSCLIWKLVMHRDGLSWYWNLERPHDCETHSRTQKKFICFKWVATLLSFDAFIQICSQKRSVSGKHSPADGAVFTGEKKKKSGLMEELLLMTRISTGSFNFEIHLKKVLGRTGIPLNVLGPPSVWPRKLIFELFSDFFFPPLHFPPFSVMNI